MNGIDGYRIVEPLSKNEKTLIYRAERASDGGRVILKTLARERGSQEEYDRYRHEYSVLQGLGNNQYICPVIALEVHDSRPVLVLADRGGVVLEAMLGQPLSIDTFLRLAIYIADALANIHMCGIVHKDMKPANIIIDDDLGKAYLIDFALASALPVEPSEVRPPRLIEGTLPYISPEQTGRMNCGHRPAPRQHPLVLLCIQRIRILAHLYLQ
jgi:serine/threonine protein kinase